MINIGDGMKILKFVKTNLLVSISILLVFTGIGVYAVTGGASLDTLVASSDVTYGNSNVQSAINDLYSKVTSSGGGKTFEMAVYQSNNDGSDTTSGGQRAALTFESEWVKNNVAKIEVKLGNGGSSNNPVLYLNTSMTSMATAASNPHVTLKNLTKTDYTEIDFMTLLNDNDLTTYPYFKIYRGGGTTVGTFFLVRITLK